MTHPLINRRVREEDLDELKAYAGTLKQLTVDNVTESDIHQIGIGTFYPLDGFMSEEDYYSVVETMRLSNGQIWTVPVTLPVSHDMVQGISLDEDLALTNVDGRLLAIMRIESIYKPDLNREAEMVYRTLELDHPGVKRLYLRGDTYLGGEIRAIPDDYRDVFSDYLFTPQYTRKKFADLGWKTVVGFQTRNPIHRAHEYIQKAALETVDGLFLNPLVGPTKSDDVPAEVRLQAYQTILEHYYPKDRVFFGVYKAAMRYAGPREAVMHALVRRNYGCSHFIVGRDHAGVGNYYGTYDSQKIFSKFSTQELGIVPLFFEHAFYCKKCLGMATTKTCPHDSEHWVILSGTKVRQMLSNGVAPPPEFSRPEVVEVLTRHYSQE